MHRDSGLAQTLRLRHLDQLDWTGSVRIKFRRKPRTDRTSDGECI